jgi:CRP/FNR family transcriptional regulator, anaerobic regulatory protein
MVDRPHVIEFLSAHDCCGLTGLDCHACSVEAVSRVVMIRHPCRLLERRCSRTPTSCAACSSWPAPISGAPRSRRCCSDARPADEHIASFLLRPAATGDPGAQPPVVTLTKFRLDIADHPGPAIETVSRTLSRLRREGLIALPGRRLITLYLGLIVTLR